MKLEKKNHCVWLSFVSPDTDTVCKPAVQLLSHLRWPVILLGVFRLMLSRISSVLHKSKLTWKKPTYYCFFFENESLFSFEMSYNSRMFVRLSVCISRKYLYLFLKNTDLKFQYGDCH